MRVIMNERTWSFGPGGSRDTSNWMGGDVPNRRPSHQPNNHTKPRRQNHDSALIKAEFKDKFPYIPSVKDIDKGFSNSVHQKAERIGRDEAIDAYAGG